MQEFELKRREREKKTPADLRRVLGRIYPDEIVDELMKKLVMEEREGEDESHIAQHPTQLV